MDNYEVENKIGQASCDLDKARIMIETVINEYSFPQQPDPRAAIEHSSKVSGPEDKHGYNSCKWYIEYGTIQKFIDIAADYIYRTQETLKEINLKTQEATK